MRNKTVMAALLAAVASSGLRSGLNFDLQSGLEQLEEGTDNFAFDLINGARPPSSYLFQQILPERERFEYMIAGGSMTVRATMAGLVGMDSPYPETGAVTINTFKEETAKIANRVPLPEKMLRDLQQLLMRLKLDGGDTNEAIAQTALNFTQLLLIQAQWDTYEYLRGRALLGRIDWTFGKIRLLVDYGIPTANKGTQRTGNDAYHGSASKFWEDVRFIRRVLKNNVRAIMTHPDTAEAIMYNPANNLITVGGGVADGFVVLQKLNTVNGQASADTNDRITLVLYGMEGEVIDPATGTDTIKIPFMPRGTLLGIGNNNGTRFEVGAGSQNNLLEKALGYTHLAPTVEGGSQPGRWARVYVPQERQYTIIGESASNGLPMIEAPEKIAITTTDMPS